MFKKLSKIMLLFVYCFILSNSIVLANPISPSSLDYETELSFSFKEQDVGSESHLYVIFDKDVEVDGMYILDECGSLMNSEYIPNLKTAMVSLRGANDVCRVRFVVRSTDEVEGLGYLESSPVSNISKLKDKDGVPLEKILGNKIVATKPIETTTPDIVVRSAPRLLAEQSKTEPTIQRTKDVDDTYSKDITPRNALIIFGVGFVGFVALVIFVVSTVMAIKKTFKGE